MSLQEMENLNGNSPLRVLVTGAAGFIGSHLCEQLLAMKKAVVGLDNFDDFYDPVIKRSNLSNCADHPQFELIEADIRDAKVLQEVMSRHRFDQIVHLAARAGVRPSLRDPITYEDVNVKGTLNLLESACRSKIKQFIFASSSSVYGNNTKVPFAETDNVDFPISPYAATKKAAELLCHTYHHIYGMDICCLRFFTVYGPRQRPDLAIHKFARLITDGHPIPVYGDGSMERDFTYIDDIIEGVISAMDHCEGFEIYNLGESAPVRLAVLISLLEKTLGLKAMIDYQPVPPGDMRRTYADISKAREDLGYNPQTPIDKGLQLFNEWFQRHCIKEKTG